MFLAGSVILTAVVVLLWFGTRFAKLPIRHRVLHIRYVIITLVLSVTGVALFSKILELINLLLSIPFLRNLLYKIIPQSNIPAGFYWIITLCCCIFFMLVFCLVLNLLGAVWLKPLSKKNYLTSKNIIEKIFNFIAGTVYEISGETSRLSPDKINVGKWIRVMRTVFGILFIAETLFIGIYLQFGFTFILANSFTVFVKSVYMIPVISYMILDQLELFLAADIKKDEKLIDTEDIGTHIQGKYDGLVDIYENYFGGKSLIAHYTGNARGSVQRELIADIQNEQRSRVDNPALLDALCRGVSCVTELNSNNVNELIDLINGSSVAIFSSVFSNFDAYYLSYAQYRLTLGNTMIVLCDTEHQVRLMTDRYEAIFKKMNTATEIWRIRNSKSFVDGETDILICTEEEYIQKAISTNNSRFFSKLKIAVVVDAYGLLCREEAYFARLFNTFENQDIQFVFYIPENNTDLRNELQHRLNNKPVGLYESPYFNPEANILLWRSESIFKPQLALSNRLYHDFGIAYTIAIIAAKYDVHCVNILSPESIPTTTYHGLVTEEYVKYLLEDYLNNGSINLASVIHNNNYALPETTELPFNVVYDENNNLLDVVKIWLSKSGSDSAMLNIISAPYMLRDYFASNIASLSAEETGVQLLIPGKSLDLYAPSVALLIKMRKGIKCEELFEFAQKYDIEENNTELILQKILDIVFSNYGSLDVYDCFSFQECDVPDFKEGEFIYTNTITLISDQLYEEVCNKTESFVRLDGDYQEVLPIHINDVYNYFLPEQCVSFNNVRYIVKSISNGTVKLKAEETVAMEQNYTVLYNIAGFKIIKSYEGYNVSNKKIRAEFFETKITREINSYYTYPGVLKFSDSDEFSIVHLKEPVKETKVVPCLHLTLKCLDEESNNKIAATICHLLKGAFETFLPKNHKEILVFSKLDSCSVCKNVDFSEDTGLLPDPIPSDLMTGFEDFETINPDICKLFPDIKSDEIKSNEADEVHIYIAHFSESDSGVITAIVNDLDRIFNTIKSYLCWVEAQSEVSSTYMRFGYTKTPGIFDSVATISCLSKVTSVAPVPTGELSNAIGNLQTGERCSFCGKPIVTISHKMDDGRIMCPECFNHKTTGRDEIKKLLVTAEDLLTKHYGITLPEQIKISFKSSSAIKKANGKKDSQSRVLGFYNIKKNEIWIERGGPETCVLSTIIHELTHAWQVANLNINDFDLKYLEGHSSYVEIESMRIMKQGIYADTMASSLEKEDSVYGRGYRFWVDYIRAENEKNIFKLIKSIEKLKD